MYGNFGLLKRMNDVRRRPPKTGDVSVSLHVFTFQFPDSMLQLTELTASWRRLVTVVCSANCTVDQLLFVFQFPDENPQVGVSNTNMLVPPIVEAYKT